MVLYFSGTGNSQYVALQLAERIEEEQVVSINRRMKAGKRETIRSKRPLVFVAPTYSWRLPHRGDRIHLQNEGTAPPLHDAGCVVLGKRRSRFIEKPVRSIWANALADCAAATAQPVGRL